MILFIVISIITFVGIGAVIFLLKNESKKTDSTPIKLRPEEIGSGGDLKNLEIEGPIIEGPPPGLEEETISPIPQAEKQKKPNVFSKLPFGKFNKPPKPTDSSIIEPLAPELDILSKQNAKTEKPIKPNIFNKFKLGNLPFPKAKDNNLPIPIEPDDLKGSSLPIPEPSLEKTGKFSLPKDLLKKQPPPDEKPMISLKEFLEAERKKKQEQQSSSTGTASLTTQPAEPTEAKPPISHIEEKKIEQEVDFSLQLNELKEKYERLDQLFTEKSKELEKTQTSLDNEVKNRKEFNKVKDILEKEIKDFREKARELQNELNNVQTENDNYKKRIIQLENKATKLEKEILVKEQEIEETKKQVAKTVPMPNPSATATQPKPNIESEKLKIDIPVIVEPPKQVEPINFEADPEAKSKADSTPKEPSKGTETGTEIANEPQKTEQKSEEGTKETEFLPLPPDPLAQGEKHDLIENQNKPDLLEKLPEEKKDQNKGDNKKEETKG